jgi:hypothetical protein
VGWESWVYPDVWDGVELTFTDEQGDGVFDFAPTPEGEGLPAAQRSSLSQWNPESIYRAVRTRFPNCDRSRRLEDPLGFYHDIATFRSGETGSTVLEVYIGVPMNMARYILKRNETRLEVDESLALLDEESGKVYHNQNRLHFIGGGNLTQLASDRVRDVLRVEVPPGPHTLDLKVADPVLKRASWLRRRVEIPDYGAPGLACSDLFLGRLSSDAEGDDRFRKGSLNIVPEPTRVFNGSEELAVYFEVYNLVRDEAGQARYNVSISLGPPDGASSSVAIPGLARYMGTDRRPCNTTFRTRSPEPFSRECLALRLPDGISGQREVSVRVTDLSTGQTATRTAPFTLID